MVYSMISTLSKMMLCPPQNSHDLLMAAYTKHGTGHGKKTISILQFAFIDIKLSRGTSKVLLTSLYMFLHVPRSILNT